MLDPETIFAFCRMCCIGCAGIAFSLICRDLWWGAWPNLAWDTFLFGFALWREKRLREGKWW